jgi:hypothetical protein
MNIKSFTLGFLAAATLGFATHTTAQAVPALLPPVKSVYDQYLKIQTELVQDSSKGVDQQAGAIAKAVRGDTTKMLPSSVADEAQELAKTTDLAAAREAFKDLSDSLIQYLADHKVPKGHYFKVFCPMANANWLQADKIIQNPYFGKTMPDCGEIKE